MASSRTQPSCHKERKSRRAKKTLKATIGARKFPAGGTNSFVYFRGHLPSSIAPNRNRDPMRQMGKGRDAETAEENTCLGSAPPRETDRTTRLGDCLTRRPARRAAASSRRKPSYYKGRRAMEAPRRLWARGIFPPAGRALCDFLRPKVGGLILVAALLRPHQTT